MKYILPVLLLLISGIGFSQTSHQFQVIKSGVVDFKAINNTWYASVQNMEMPSPEGSSDKAKLLRLKRGLELKYPRKKIGKLETKASSPEVFDISGFEGNAYNNRVPNDNAMAISDAGILMSCTNNRVVIYDTEADTLMDTGFLQDFVMQFNVTASRYDPKMIYDQNEDKFILTFLVGTHHVNSKIAVCFSTSNNPIDDWNVYLLPGDPLLTDHWTDYPAIALSEDEFFVTGNLLADNQSWQTGFNQSIIWQIDKHSGYGGNVSLTTQLWTDIYDDSIKVRNIHPVRGARKLYGPNQYFLSNKNFSAESDTVYLLEITNKISSSEHLNQTLLSTPDHYFMSPSGRQSIAKLLATNDSRMLGAIRDDSWIQYVHNSMDTATGNAAVYHGTIDNFESTPLVSGVILSDSIKDYGYPNIASTGIDPDEKECVIGFNYTSPLDSAGVGCYYMDTNEVYSDFNLIKLGEAPINTFVDSLDRWGDYFAIQRQYSSPCNVWTAGMYGKTGENGTWIGRVAVEEACRIPTPIEDSLNPAFNNGAIFPNPSVDWVTFDFELDESLFIKVELFDTKGGLIKVLYEDVALQGENRLTFNGFYLNQGMYILRILNNDKVLFTEKLVKQ
jgi:hypothetical protein